MRTRVCRRRTPWQPLLITRDSLFAVSTFTKGEQMVPVLNELNVQCAVYGNHDFGEEKAVKQQTRRSCEATRRECLGASFISCRNC